MSTEIVLRREPGFTLIELIIAMVIISSGVVGILSVMNVTVKSSADPLLYKQAMAMAEAILDEVLAKEYSDEVLAKEYSNPSGGFVETSPQTCAGRLFYDDVDDYSCFDGSTSSKVIMSNTTLGGITSALQNYTATIRVLSYPVNSITMKQVTVTVTGGGVIIALNGYRSDY